MQAAIHAFSQKGLTYIFDFNFGFVSLSLQMHEAKMVEGIEGDVLPRVIERTIQDGRIICFDEFQVRFWSGKTRCFIQRQLCYRFHAVMFLQIPLRSTRQCFPFDHTNIGNGCGGCSHPSSALYWSVGSWSRDSSNLQSSTVRFVFERATTGSVFTFYCFIGGERQHR